jgi:hypothetical protein
VSDRSFLQIQAIQLRQLLAEASDDPILAPQLEQRVAEIESELKSLMPSRELFPPEAFPAPRVALFLKGKGVQGSEGIRPALAGEALIQYEKMYVEQVLHDERVAARDAGRIRRRRGSENPALYFTGTPRGSFGLEFIPQPTFDEKTLTVHSRALKHLAEALVRVSSGDASLESSIDGIPSPVLRPMKRFFKTLAQYDAELRLAFSDAPPKVISETDIRQAADRLDRELDVDELTVRGVFRGLTRESTYFDVIADGIGVITGTIADGLTEEDFDRISLLTNKRCIALIQKTTLRHVGGTERVTYVLLSADPEPVTDRIQNTSIAQTDEAAD